MTSTPTFSQDIIEAAYETAAAIRYELATATADLIHHNQALDEIIARAIMADRQRDQWQGIGSAPKDGSLILAFNDLAIIGFDKRIVKWGNLFVRSAVDGNAVDEFGWTQPGITGSTFKATHWMPLPPAPSIQGEG